MLEFIVFDLDDTLIVDKQVTNQALLDVFSALHSGQMELTTELISSFQSNSERLLSVSQMAKYCQEIGISAIEILWCEFNGESSDDSAMSRWASGFRREAWGSVLRDNGIFEDGLAKELETLFFATRRARQRNFEDAKFVLEALYHDYTLGLITNGISCLQRQKLSDSQLASYFDTVVVSSEVGVGKPNAAIFNHAANKVGVKAESTMMVGNSLERDVAGAASSGMASVWLNRSNGSQSSCGLTIHSLWELPELLPDFPPNDNVAFSPTYKE